METNHSSSTSWLSDLQSQLHETSEYQLPAQRCIFRAPPSIRKGGDEEYEPKVVSLGPYHHGKQHLMAFEAHKWRTLLHCVRRSKIEDVNHLVQEVEKEVSQLKKCYNNLDESSFTDQDFVKFY